MKRDGELGHREQGLTTGRLEPLDVSHVAIRVLIVDDHVVVRRGIGVLLGTEEDIEVVGEAENGREAVAKADSLQPNIILMDLVMPEMDGIEATRRVSARHPDTGILILTSFATDDMVFPAIKAGALGYLLKDSTPEQLVAAIRQVYRGEPSLHPTIAKKVLHELSRPPKASVAPRLLKDQEIEILQLLARGQDNRQIAEQLSITEKTVRGLVSQILGKLHLASRTEAALYAMQQGLASLDELAPSQANRLLTMLAKTARSPLAVAEGNLQQEPRPARVPAGEQELEGLRLIAADHRKRGQELALAGEIQRSFLPEAVPAVTGWELAATLRPAKETAGDFYDFICLPSDRLGIVIADVADKGLGAALYMALSRTLIRTYVGQHPTSPELVLKAVNNRILRDTRATLFVTVFYGIVDLESGWLTYCNAGHNPPYLMDGKNCEPVRELSRTGMALGLYEAMTWRQEATSVAPGDTLVLYTDGVTEAQDQRQALFGAARLRKLARTHVGSSAKTIQNALIAEVDRFAGDAPQSDDIALMIVVRDG